MRKKEESRSGRSMRNEIRVAFVDGPRAAVKRADNLVIETTGRLA